MPKRLYFKADNYMYMVYKEQKNEKATKNNKEV